MFCLFGSVLQCRILTPFYLQVAAAAAAAVVSIVQYMFVTRQSQRNNARDAQTRIEDCLQLQQRGRGEALAVLLQKNLWGDSLLFPLSCIYDCAVLLFFLSSMLLGFGIFNFFFVRKLHRVYSPFKEMICARKPTCFSTGHGSVVLRR